MRLAGPSNVHNRHGKQFPLLVQEVVRISDIILEVLDCRHLEETRNKDVENHILEQGKILVHVLNKCDLIDLKTFDREKLKEYSNPVFVSYNKKIGLGKLLLKIKMLSKKVKDYNRVHVGIVGYPNTGKSSLINYLSHRHVAHASHESGLTRGIRKVRLTSKITLIDTPGVLKQKEFYTTDSKEKAQKSIFGVETWSKVKDPELVVDMLFKKNESAFNKHYSVESEGDSEIFLTKLAERWKFVKKKAELDFDRTARRVLKDWQEGNIKN